MGAVCLSAALSVTALTKTVKITDGENTTVINTMNLDQNAILEQAGVELGDNDKVVLTETSGNGVEVSIMRAFNVNLEADGDVQLQMHSRLQILRLLLLIQLHLLQEQHLSLI